MPLLRSLPVDRAASYRDVAPPELMNGNIELRRSEIFIATSTTTESAPLGAASRGQRGGALRKFLFISSSIAGGAIPDRTYNNQNFRIEPSVRNLLSLCPL